MNFKMGWFSFDELRYKCARSFIVSSFSVISSIVNAVTNHQVGEYAQSAIEAAGLRQQKTSTEQSKLILTDCREIVITC